MLVFSVIAGRCLLEVVFSVWVVNLMIVVCCRFALCLWLVSLCCLLLMVCLPGHRF